MLYSVMGSTVHIPCLHCSYYSRGVFTSKGEREKGNVWCRWIRNLNGLYPAHSLQHWQPKPNWRREKLTYILVCDISYLWVSLCAISVLRTMFIMNTHPLPSRGCWYVCHVMFLPLISFVLLQLLLHVFFLRISLSLSLIGFDFVTIFHF